MELLCIRLQDIVIHDSKRVSLAAVVPSRLGSAIAVVIIANLICTRIFLLQILAASIQLDVIVTLQL